MKEVLAKSDSRTPFTWIDITQPDYDELHLIAKDFNLHEYTVRDCLEPDHLPKFELFETTRFLIVRLYSPKNQKNPHTIQELTSKIAVFYNDQFLITIHRQPQPLIHMIKGQCLDSNKCATIPELVTKIIWYALNTYQMPYTDLDNKISHYEDELFLKDYIPKIQKSLYFLKRKAASCKKVIHLTTDVINKAHQGMSNNPSMQDLMDLHVKLTTQYDQIMEDASTLVNTYIAISSQKTNEVMKILTIFSVFFMPLTFIVGIYGMNFEYMPELKSKWGYPAVLVLMVVVTLYIYYRFRHQRLIKK